MSRETTQHRVLLATLLLAGCTETPVVEAQDASTGGSSTSTAQTSADSMPSTGASTTEPGEVAGSSSSTSGNDTDTDTDTTGETSQPVSFELLVRRRNAGGDDYHFVFRVEDGVADTLVGAHEQEPGAHWSRPIFMSEHRVAFSVDLEDSPNELRLLSLDDALPADSVRLDVAPGGTGIDGQPVVVAADESILYQDDATMYRVTIDGLDAAEPVALTPLAPHPLFRPTVDPQGRYALVFLPEDEAGNNRVARVVLDGSSTESLPGTGTMPTLTPDGNAGFRVMSVDDETQRLEYIPLGDELGLPVPMLPDVVAPEELFFNDNGVRPHQDRQGFVIPVGLQFEGSLLYIGVQDGVPQPPVALNGPETGGTLPNYHAWSPDGRWLLFATHTDGMSDMSLAHFGAGDEPEITQAAPPLLSLADHRWHLWAPDSSALYIQYTWTPEQEPYIERIQLTDDGPEVQAVAEPGSIVNIQELSADGSSLLYRRQEDPDGAQALFIADVSGDVPGAPVQLSDLTEPGDWIRDASFSPDGRVVAYGLDVGNTHLLVATPEDPKAEPVEAVHDLIDGDWWFVPPAG